MPVSTKLAYEIFFIEFWHILSLMLILSVNYIITLKARKTPLLFSYLTAQSMLVIWILSKIFKTVSPNIELRWFFIVTQYFGATFLGGSLIIFAYIYIKKELPSIRKLILWNIPALYSFIVVVTNPLHHKFYSRFTFYADDFGPLFYLNMTITYFYLIITIFALARGFFKMFGRERKRAYLFLGGIIVPLIINIFYVLDIFEALFNYQPLFDYTPIATNASLIFFALAAFQYRFLDVLPMAGRQIFDGIGDAVAIIDKKNTVLSHNKNFSILFAECTTLNTLPKPLLAMPNSIKCGERIYRITYKQKRKYRIIRLTDITVVSSTMSLLEVRNTELSKSNSRLEELLAKKQNLARMKTRNYILQELHDILGHAIVLAIAACEADILSGASGYKTTLPGVKKLILESKNELEKVLNTAESTEEHTSLFIAIDALTRETKSCGINIDLIIQGAVYELDRLSSEAAYRLCQEAITNSVKHSNASILSIVLRYNENDFEIFVIDNGRGCEAIKHGNGLGGMADRIIALGGHIEFFSDIDSGFQIHARIPKVRNYDL